VGIRSHGIGEHGTLLDQDELREIVMGKTVVGVFDGDDDAMRGRRALVEAGFQQAGICIYSDTVSTETQHGPRIYTRGDVGANHESPALDQVERLFERLFTQGKYPPETAHYREVIRRGGAILSIDVADDQAESARDAMARAGSIDIDERVAAWQRERHQNDLWDGPVRRAPVDEGLGDERTHLPATLSDFATSPDQERPEPFRGSIRGSAGARASSRAASPRNDNESAYHHPQTLADSLTGQTKKATFTTRVLGGANRKSEAPRRVSAASEPSSRMKTTENVDISRALRETASTQSEVPEHSAIAQSSAKATEEKSVSGRGIGSSSSTDIDKPATAEDSAQRFSSENGPPEYEDDFDYDTRNPTAVLPHEDGDGHRRGLAHGSDAAHVPYDWPPPLESSAPQRSEVADSRNGWERFKRAVRHGWERVSGDHRRHRHP
jgi:hypothetical protein